MKRNKPDECESDPIEDAIEKAALELYEKFGVEELEIILKKSNSTIRVYRPIAERVIDRYSFNEAHRYLKNAKRRFNTKTPEGYSNCKADCRNGLMSALKTLTGMNTIKDAATELHIQGILGKREEEFYKTFGNLLVILHGIDSKKGSHPPMERNEDDAELAVSITTSVVNYLINQATKPRV
ncbi:hypothetical protein ES703_07599 [subsurface metagenome]